MYVNRSVIDYFYVALVELGVEGRGWGAPARTEEEVAGPGRGVVFFGGAFAWCSCLLSSFSSFPCLDDE